MRHNNKCLELNRIFSEKKRNQIFEILHDTNFTHNQFLWLCGFLLHTGYSEGDIFHIIKRLNKWDKFDSKEVRYQLRNLAERQERFKVWKAENSQKNKQKSESKEVIGISLRGRKAERILQKSGQQVISC